MLIERERLELNDTGCEFFDSGGSGVAEKWENGRRGLGKVLIL